MDALNEELLEAWLKLSTYLNNDRIVSDLPFNESLVCNFLYHHQMQSPEKNMTATDLCQKTKMLKSQMNRTLNNLEEKGLILRERSTTDKRQVYISLTGNEISIYENQHERVLQLVDTIIQELGVDNTRKTIELFTKISNIANEVLYD